jgi:DDE superfamily endonuclease
MTIVKQKRYFTLREKIAMVEEFTSSVTATCASIVRKYKLDKSQFRRWRKNIGALRASAAETSKQSRTNISGAGRPALVPFAIQQALLEHVDLCREDEQRVTVATVTRHLIQIVPESASVSLNALRQRVRKLLVSNGVVLRAVTHVAQNTRTVLANMVDWVKVMVEQREMYGIPLKNVANFDETNVYWSPVARTTLNRAGARTVSVRGGNLNHRSSVMLGVSATGYKFPPFVIYIGGRGASGRILAECNKANRELAATVDGSSSSQNYPYGCYYEVQEKGWMNEELMLIWIATIWKPWADQKSGIKMLILDVYTAHMTARVRAALHDCQTVPFYVPGGYTSKLQVLDVGINKPFKDHIRDNFELFKIANPNAKPSRQVVAHWVASSWDNIPLQTIENTWKKVLKYGQEEDVSDVGSVSDDSDFLALQQVDSE